MIYAVLAVGFLLAITGLTTAYHGYGIIEIERGWTAVIAGVVALTGGVITIVLGLVLRTLGQIKQILESEGHMAALTRAISLPDDLAVRRGFDGLPTAPMPPQAAPAYEPEAVQAAPLFQPEAAQTAKEHTGREDYAFPAHPALAPDIEIALQEELARAVIASQETAWQEPEESSLRREQNLAAEVERVSHAAAALAEPLDEAFIPPHHEEATESLGHQMQTAWAHEPEVALKIEEEIATEIREFSFQHEQAEDVEPLPPAWAEPERTASEPQSFQTADVGDAAYTPPPELAEPEAVQEKPLEPEPIVEAPPQPAPPHEAKPRSKAVIGRYEADGTTYIMFSDGSIEAHSERGIARFKSMADLKAYMETEASTS